MRHDTMLSPIYKALSFLVALCYKLHSAASSVGATHGFVPREVSHHASGASCQASLDANHVELAGRFAILSLGNRLPASTEMLVKQQTETLYACNFLRLSEDKDLVVTVTSNAQAAKLALQSLAQRHPVLIMHISPWPGNTAKIVGFANLLQSVMRVERSQARSQASAGVAQIRVLLTDCCDVFVRNDDWCSGAGTDTGGGGLFARFDRHFKQYGWRVVFSAERGTLMLASNEDYLAKLDASPPYFSTKPPKGWLVPVWHGRSRKLRQARFSHAPSELPPTPLLLGTGTPDVCTEVERVCIHHKSLNAGLVIGDLEALANFYQEVLRLCGDGCGSGNPADASEQNVVAHYLLTSHFCQGRCSLDYNFTLFHSVQLWGSGDYQIKTDNHALGTHGKTPRLYIKLPIAKFPDNSSTQPGLLGNSHDSGVLVSSDWIALSPEVYKEAWFSVPACVFHAAGLPNLPRGAPNPNLDLIRSGLDLHAPLQRFSLLQEQGAVVAADGNVIVHHRRRALVRSAKQHY